MNIDSSIYKEFLEIAGPVISTEEFKRQRAFKQHGSTSVYDHVMHVALRAFTKAYKKKEKYDLKALVYGALLHDYFLYDWHIFNHKNGHKRFHGFNHPKIALNNALKVYALDKKTRNIIRSHMWPLTLFHIPTSREAWLVTICDKVVSFKETFKIKEDYNIC